MARKIHNISDKTFLAETTKQIKKIKKKSIFCVYWKAETDDSPHIKTKNKY